MSPLERRGRLLLRAYPAAYRRDRGEEILGTLLEVTPAGRGWPRLRDVRSLAIAGLRERAAQNRRLTTAANARSAALIGVVAYLGLGLGGNLSVLMLSELNAVAERSAVVLWPSRTALAFVACLIATAALAWVSRRRLLVLAAAAPAAAIVCLNTSWSTGFIWPSVTQLVCVAALFVLAGGDVRPSRRWLWPVGLIAAAPLLADLPVVHAPAMAYLLVPVVLVACIAWIGVDARPAIGVAVFLFLYSLAVFGVDLGGPVRVSFLAALGVAASMALWRLRRQSAHGGGPGATAA